MERRKFSREFKLEAVKLVRERGFGRRRAEAERVPIRRWSRREDVGIAGRDDQSNAGFIHIGRPIEDRQASLHGGIVRFRLQKSAGHRSASQRAAPTRSMTSVFLVALPDDDGFELHEDHDPSLRLSSEF